MKTPFTFRSHYFTPPPYIMLEDHIYDLKTGTQTYTQRNYLMPGVGSLLRVRHFDYALRLTKKYFHKCNVIDFGCADGPFLPSLAKYFNNVLATDKNPKFMELSAKVVSAADLKNIKLLCNYDLVMEDVREKIGNEKFHILYLLETLEHIGDKSNLWESKVNFVESLFELIDENGIIVISVPNMIGISFLLQRLGLFLLGSGRESISKINLLRAGLFNNTTNLEQQWQEGHLGFNHQKLERSLCKKLRIIERKNIIFQIIYIIGRR